MTHKISAAAETVQKALLEGLIVKTSQTLAVPWNRSASDRPDLKISGKTVKPTSARGRNFLVYTGKHASAE